MITKERLKELIKQGATVLVKTVPNRIIRVNTKSAEVDVIDDKLYFNGGKWFPIEDVYSDEAELQKAEWQLKTYAERTERFEPPMWEEIEKKYNFYFFIKDTFYAFQVNKDLRRIEFIRDYIVNMFLFSDKEFTKENYEKACEIVRDLFKGEK